MTVALISSPSPFNESVSQEGQFKICTDSGPTIERNPVDESMVALPDISSLQLTAQLLLFMWMMTSSGHDDVVNVLLRHFRHVRIDQCNKLGFTALMKAAIQGRTRCAKLLLFAGL